MSTTALTIIKEENVALIVKAAPQSYNDNRQSHDRCLTACRQLLDTIEQQGMNEQLDQQAAKFIEKSRKTIKAMNERRSPVTKLFDEIRTAYTTFENDIDPSKKGSVPNQLQQLRNQYAAHKRAEQLRLQQEEAERQQHQAALSQFALDVEIDLKNKFSSLSQKLVDYLYELDKSITLKNFNASAAEIKNFGTEYPETFGPRTSVPIAAGITAEEAANIERQTLQRLKPQMEELHKTAIEKARDYILDRLANKRQELEAMAKASEEEAERIKKEKEEREKKEEEQRKCEEQKKKDKQAEQAQQQQQQQDMQNLFASQATVQGYAPKTKVTKKINLLNPEGILPIISMWFANEGCKMTVEELAKKFKFAVTYCEKLANKEGTTIKDESIEYIDEVKAK